MFVRSSSRHRVIVVLLAATMLFWSAARADDDAPQPTPASPERQPLGDSFDITPAPAPFVLDTQRTELEQVVYQWPAKDENVLRVVRLKRDEELSASPPDHRTPDNIVRVMTESLPKEQLLQPPQVLKDPRFVVKLRYVLKGEGSRDYEYWIFRKVGENYFGVNAMVQLPANRIEPSLEAIQKLAEDVAMTIRPKGEPSPGPIKFGTAAGGPVVASKPAGAKPATRPESAADASAANQVAPSPAPSATRAAETPAQALEAARRQKAEHPAEAYAALKAVASSSAPGSAVARAAAAQDMAAMERDPAVAKKVMAAEGKALSAFSMAQNFQNSGQRDKAKQRYEQLVKDFPDTMCAAVARVRLEEIAKAPKGEQ